MVIRGLAPVGECHERNVITARAPARDTRSESRLGTSQVIAAHHDRRSSDGSGQTRPHEPQVEFPRSAAGHDGHPQDQFPGPQTLVTSPKQGGEKKVCKCECVCCICKKESPKADPPRQTGVTTVLVVSVSITLTLTLTLGCSDLVRDLLVAVVESTEVERVDPLRSPDRWDHSYEWEEPRPVERRRQRRWRPGLP